MSLYGKYRPKTFADVVAQEHVVGTLENASKQGSLGQAYLFAGPRGTGKTSIARIVAKEMLTRGMTDATLIKQIRTAVDEGTLVDLVEIDAASNRGIDDIRMLVEKIQFSPVAAAAKVYIIDEVHMLTREAFNALLKTLEEPPPYAFFILATTELQKIPATIQSRCQRFAFHQVSDEHITQRLQFIADQEHITIDRPALRAIAHHAQGGLRDAISLLDQLRSLPTVTLADVEQKIGSSTQEDTEHVLAALESNDAQLIVDTVRGMEKKGLSLETFARQLLAEVRRRMHVALESGQPIEHLLALSGHLLSAIRDMRLSPVPGLALETALLTLHTRGTAATESTPPPQTKAAAKVEAKTEATAKKVAKVEPIAPVETPTPAAARIDAPPLTIDTITSAWNDILVAVTPASVRMSLKNGRVTGVRESTITLSFASAFHRDKVRAIDAARLVEEAMTTILRQAVRIECILEEDAGATVATSQQMVNLVEAAGEVF